MAKFWDLSRELRDMVYSLLFQQYRITATIQSVNPIIIYARKLTQIPQRVGPFQKRRMLALTEVHSVIRQEALAILFEQLIELRFDQTSRSVLAISPKYLRNVEVIRGSASGPSCLSDLELPVLKKILIYRPAVSIASGVLFDSFWYIKGRVQRSWIIHITHFCLPGTLLHEVINEKRNTYDVLCYCDIVLEGRDHGIIHRSRRRKLTIFDLDTQDLVGISLSNSVGSIFQL